MNVIAIVIGFVVWLVVPLLINDHVKRKAQKKAVSMLCRIVGIAIISVAVLKYILSLICV